MENLVYNSPTSVMDVYGLVPTSAPNGYEYTGEFRPPRVNEEVLNAATAYRKLEAYTWLVEGGNSPRLILRRKLTLADKWHIAPLGALRRPVEGEFFSGGAYIRKVGQNDPPSGEYLILTPAPGFTPIQDEDYRIW